MVKFTMVDSQTVSAAETTKLRSARATMNAESVPLSSMTSHAMMLSTTTPISSTPRAKPSIPTAACSQKLLVSSTMSSPASLVVSPSGSPLWSPIPLQQRGDRHASHVYIYHGSPNTYSASETMSSDT